MANGAGQQAAPVRAAPAPAEPAWEDYQPGEQGWQDFAAPAPKRGMFERFSRSLRESMGFNPETSGPMEDLRTIGSGLKMEFTHPIESGKLLWEDMNRGEQELVDKAYTEQHSSDLGTRARGFVRGAYSAVPFIGPALSRAGDEATEGNYAGMAGTMTGTAGMLSDDMAAAGMREPIERGIHATRQAAGNVVRAVPEVGGAVGGYAAGSAAGHPWLGAYAGREIGRRLRPAAGRLAEAIEGEKPGPTGPLTGDLGLTPGYKTGLFGDLPSTADETAASSKASPGTRTLRGDLRMPREGTTSSGAPSTGEVPKDAAPAAKETTKYPIRNRAQQAAAAKREAAGRTTFSRGPQSMAPSAEARPVPRKGQDLPTERPSLRSEMGEKPGYDIGERAHWIDSDGKINSSHNHASMTPNIPPERTMLDEYKDILTQHAESNKLIRAMSDGPVITVDIPTSGATPGHIRGIAKLMKDTGKPVDAYIGDKPIGQFPTIGGLQRELRKGVEPDWTEEARRRSPGIPPERRSLRRQMEKKRGQGPTPGQVERGEAAARGQQSRITKRKAEDAESRRQAKRGAAASEND